MDFNQLAILVVAAGVFGTIAKILKQPIIIGYIFSGFLLSISGIIKDPQLVSNFGRIGVALLLFLVGIEMRLKEVPSIGKVALITGIGQILLTVPLVYILSMILGFGLIPSFYISLALSFSSTIIVIKLISEKKDLLSLYGRITVGTLLVQDFIAIAVIFLISNIENGGISLYQIFINVFKALILIFIVWLLSKKVLPSFFDKVVANSQELLFIVGIAWAFGFSGLVAGPFGFSIEIGGFLAGLSLSNLPEHLQLAARTRPLRDFFLTLFFLFLGTQFVVDKGLGVLIIPVIVFSIFEIIVKPIILMIILGYLGYKKRTTFISGITMSQISEFSLILMALGKEVGQLTNMHISIMVLVGIITYISSSYLFRYSNKIYKVVNKYLGVFERRIVKEKVLYTGYENIKNHVILIGCDRTGKSLVPFFLKNNIPFLVVDYNPVIFTNLTAKNIPVIFGDVSDSDILEAAKINKSDVVISTIPNLEDNLEILEYVKNLEKHPLVIVLAQTKADAIKLYEKGSDFVIVPEIVTGDYLRNIFRMYGFNRKKIINSGKNHFNRMISI